MLAIATFTSSFGQIFHTEHLLVVHLAILAGAALVAGAADRGRDRSGWPLNMMMAATATAYVVTGIAKLRLGGSDWLTGEGLRRWVAVDNLRKAVLDDPYSALGGWLVGIGWIWAPIALATLVIELGAPAALRRGRVRLAWVVAAWSFHVGVLVVMAISFPYQLTGIAFVAFVDVERIEARWRSRGLRRARTRRSSSDPIDEFSPT
jgi:membrane protein implicated in regulation of membrane protease activity